MIIPKIIHESWHEDLQPLFDDMKMSMILNTISKSSYYPQKADVFRVFKMPMDKIKAVCLGQDPYSNAGEATGLAFGVNPDKNTPQSLIIIKNEIKNSIYIEREMFSQTNYPDVIYWKTLEHLWKQGVFLLNAALTVESRKPNSHTLIWQWFTRVVVNTISKKQPCVWLLWGSNAKSYESYIDKIIPVNGNGTPYTGPTNSILTAPHPVAEAYDPNRTPKFTGCNHFNLCNNILEGQGKTKIIW